MGFGREDHRGKVPVQHILLKSCNINMFVTVDIDFNCMAAFSTIQLLYFSSSVLHLLKSLTQKTLKYQRFTHLFGQGKISRLSGIILHRKFVFSSIIFFVQSLSIIAWTHRYLFCTADICTIFSS